MTDRMENRNERTIMEEEETPPEGGKIELAHLRIVPILTAEPQRTDVTFTKKRENLAQLDGDEGWDE